jgi:hypothetical protein
MLNQEQHHGVSNTGSPHAPAIRKTAILESIGVAILLYIRGLHVGRRILVDEDGSAVPLSHD